MLRPQMRSAPSALGNPGGPSGPLGTGASSPAPGLGPVSSSATAGTVAGGAPGSPLNYGGLAARGGKAKQPVSTGILGSVKNRILSSMLDAVSGEYKILICDRTGAEIISTCLRMHELMEHGVVLVEDLFLDRQPIITSPALYFISPDAASVARVSQDWETKNMYKEAHIYFTGVTPDPLINQIASNPKLAKKVVTLKDMMLDFAVPETLLFHLNMPADIPKLYPQEIALSGGRENILGQVALRLVSVFFTLGGGVPVIRYQGSSRLAQQVGRTFCDHVARMSKDVPDFRLSSPTASTPLLIIVDRSFDAAAPLVHERTYQCMLNDLMPLPPSGIYEQQFQDRDGTTKSRQCPIGEEDPYWCFYRHRFFVTCLEELPKKLQELIEANPSLAKGMQSGGGGDSNRALANLGSAVRALPEFQEKQSKLSMHIDICTRLMDRYRQQRLAEVCEVEQDLTTERKSFKDNLEAVRRLTSDGSVPTPVRVRLLLLLISTANTREFTEGKKQQLIQESGLMSEANRCANIDMFIVRQGKLPQPAGAGAGTGSSQTDSRGSSATSFVARTLRQKRNAAAASASSTSMASTASPGGAAVGDPFKNQAYLILDAAAEGTLSVSDFPVLNPAMSAMDGLAGAGAASKRTLRMGLARMQDGEGAAATGGAAANAYNSHAGKGYNGLLDLGFEGQFSLNNQQRVVLFVLGGATYGEARAAYEVSKKHFREVIVGGTSLLQPDQFVTQLASLR